MAKNKNTVMIYVLYNQRLSTDRGKTTPQTLPPSDTIL